VTEDELFRVGLLDMSEALHTSKTGASDPLPDQTTQEYVSYIQQRLAQWSPSPDYSFLYDMAVKNLLLCVLAEQTKGAA
jgi:hypothetical protein